MTSRPFLVPEVLQTSGMDCGPAALKALLGGLGLQVNYGKLREACNTSADGTSIEALEELCIGLGMDAYQEIAPLGDAVEILTSRAPCVAVVTTATNACHFIVIWRRLGSWIQIMDPARGRRWVHREELARTLHVHHQPFDDETFGQWLPTTAWFELLQRRLRRLGALALLGANAPAKHIGALDAAARVVERLVARGAIPGSAKARVVENLAREELSSPGGIPVPMQGSARWHDGSFAVRGTVFLVVRNPGGAARDAALADPTPLAKQVIGPSEPTALTILYRHLSPRSRALAALLAILAAFVAVASLFEMIVLRAAFNAKNLLSLPQQRFAGIAVYGLLVLFLLAVEALLAVGGARIARSLELRTRLSLLLKLPRLPDRYFRTRPMSDVAHRSQGLFQVKPLPELAVMLVKQSLDIVITVAALAFLYPRGLVWISLCLLFTFVVPFVSVRMRWRVEHRVLSHAGALAQVYLDVLRGLNPLRTHGGSIAIRTKQSGHLVDWRNEADQANKLLSVTEALQSGGTLFAIAGLLLAYQRSVPGQADLLLMAFWALRLPLYARSLSASTQRIPALVAAIVRLVEPLSAAETSSEQEIGETTLSSTRRRRGMAIRLEGVRVVLSGREVLSSMSVAIRPGEHVAVVGNSGAGKSSLLAAILGVLDCDEGRIVVDGLPAARYGLSRLRRECVWVDPVVQLWDRSLLDNLHFGNPPDGREPLSAAIEAVSLKDLLERLPQGLATHLGEGGCRVSGGEGQRVRLGRAFLRSGARLVLLDEAFRGLERATRQRLSRAVRERDAATVIEVTHDVADTRDYDRILVVEDGRLVEEGAPGELLASAGSRYRALVEADHASETEVWEAEHWRRFRVEDGHVEQARQS
jgi:ABC-type bacteriocin/lantibiotic exporter with double-glycine peptidase domain